jgi:hypothetical protein
MIEEEAMTQVTGTFRKSVAQRAIAIACLAVLGVTASACGSTTKSGPNNSPAGTTVPSKAAASSATTGPATTAPSTTAAPKSGGAGF